MWRNGDHDGAKDRLQTLIDLIREHESSATAEGTSSTLEMILACRLDMAELLLNHSGCSGSEASLSEAHSIARAVFFQVESVFGDGAVHTLAFQRRLSSMGLTHFQFSKETCPFEEVERIGHGAHALVDSVRHAHQLFAQKTFLLRHSRRRYMEEMIRNEVSLLQQLQHPHIVYIYCTYELANRYSLVMCPLADFDLETFLHNPVLKDEFVAINDARTKSDESLPTILTKWLLCLSNTVQFIHTQGIRHKDIKPRNILIKERSVFLADFGSGHSFYLEENSTTEGPSYGHTRMYSAPEVIAEEKRNRAADIFSLGCVFSEILTIMMGKRVEDFHQYRVRKYGERSSVGSWGYYATLDMVEKWFSNYNSAPTLENLNSASSSHFDKLEMGLILFKNVVQKMIAKAANTRITAERASVYLTMVMKAKNLNGEVACTSCRVPMLRDTMKSESSSNEEHLGIIKMVYKDAGVAVLYSTRGLVNIQITDIKRLNLKPDEDLQEGTPIKFTFKSDSNNSRTLGYPFGENGVELEFISQDGMKSYSDPIWEYAIGNDCLIKGMPDEESTATGI